VVVIWNK